MSDSEISSLASGPSSPAQPKPSQSSPEKPPTGNRYDEMFGSDHSSAEDSDEDAGARKRTRKNAGLDDEPEEEPAPVDDDDLFGDGDGDEADAEQRRASPTPEPERFIEVTLPRHPGPIPDHQNQLHILKVPDSLTIEPTLFDPQKFTLPTLPADSPISAYTTATTTIRTRKHPREPQRLQSNARVIRWNDGSYSLQIASSPNLYDLPSKPLTNTLKDGKTYDPAQDAHTYLVDPHVAAGTLRVIAHATSSMKVVSASTSMVSDHSIQRLHTQLASAMQERSGGRKQMEITEMRDPEKERKEAEKIAREKERLARKQEAARKRRAEREGAGIDVGRRAYQKVTGTRSKRESPPIRGSRGGREDEYDLEDGFIEETDEEEEQEESEEEEEEEELERRPRRGGDERDRKRRRVVDDEEDDDE